jgi:hypothetical protein
MDAGAMIVDGGFLVVGLLVGTLHFALLRWNAALYAQAGRVWTAAALQAVRFGVLAGVLTMSALHGALALLLTALGLLIARPIVIRWMMMS